MYHILPILMLLDVVFFTNFIILYSIYIYIYCYLFKFFVYIFAFVFVDTDAVMADQHTIDGRQVEAKRALPRDKTPNMSSGR